MSTMSDSSQENLLGEALKPLISGASSDVDEEMSEILQKLKVDPVKHNNYSEVSANGGGNLQEALLLGHAHSPDKERSVPASMNHLPNRLDKEDGQYDAKGTQQSSSGELAHPAALRYAPYLPGGLLSPGSPVPAGGEGQMYMAPHVFQYSTHMYHQPMPPGSQYPPPFSEGRMTPPGARNDCLHKMQRLGGYNAYEGNMMSGRWMAPRMPFGRGAMPPLGQKHSAIYAQDGHEGRKQNPSNRAAAFKGDNTTGFLPANRTAEPFHANGRGFTARNSSFPPEKVMQSPWPGSSANYRGGPWRRDFPEHLLPGQSFSPTRIKACALGGYTNTGHWSGGLAWNARNGNFGLLNAQNRRMKFNESTLRMLHPPRGHGAKTTEDDGLTALKEQYNRADFPTKYEDAKFFVIKSYSEDDVHKSIKYNVWASTPNGNKRLDAAYHDAQLKIKSNAKECPVFLFFSVNASGQFCGVAEMTSPVDFSKSVDFWLEDKWTGKFTVRWHIVKDIPNSQLRHIILQNNENRPVTNSRDTQEVDFVQGLEMLNIFKNFDSKTSILEDFDFYERKHEMIQEKKSQQKIKHHQQETMGFEHVNEKDDQKDEVGSQADKVTSDDKSQVRENDVNVDIPEQQASSKLREGEDATADDSVEHKVSDEQTSNAATDDSSDSSCKKEEPTVADDFQNKFKPEVHEVEGSEAAKSSMTPLIKCDPRKSYSAVVRNKIVDSSSSSEQKV